MNSQTRHYMVFLLMFMAKGFALYAVPHENNALIFREMAKKIKEEKRDDIRLYLKTAGWSSIGYGLYHLHQGGRLIESFEQPRYIDRTLVKNSTSFFGAIKLIPYIAAGARIGARWGEPLDAQTYTLFGMGHSMMAIDTLKAAWNDTQFKKSAQDELLKTIYTHRLKTGLLSSLGFALLASKNGDQMRSQFEFSH